MARNLKDAFYNAQFRVGQGIFTRAVSQGDNSLTESNFTGLQTFDAVLDDVDAVGEYSNSELSLVDVSTSEIGMEKVGDRDTAINALIGNTNALNTLVDSNSGMSGIVKSQNGMTEVAASQTAMDAVIASQLALDTVVASQTAMNAVAASQTAMDAVAASQTAMDAVMPSLDARTRLTLSSFARDSLWTASTGSQRYWDEGQTFSVVPSKITFEFVDVFANSAIDFRIDYDGASNQDRKEGFGLNLDFDQIDQLKVDTEFTGDQRQGANFLAIFAGATELFAIDTTHSQTTRTLDTSSISGTKELQLVYEQRAANNDTFQMIFGLVSAS